MHCPYLTHRFKNSDSVNAPGGRTRSGRHPTPSADADTNPALIDRPMNSRRFRPVITDLLQPFPDSFGKGQGGFPVRGLVHADHVPPLVNWAWHRQTAVIVVTTIHCDNVSDVKNFGKCLDKCIESLCAILTNR
jgi:hypothetical protein